MPGRTRIRPRRFQSTLSVRRATQEASGGYTIFKFQSTLSVRRATLHSCCWY